MIEIALGIIIGLLINPVKQKVIEPSKSYIQKRIDELQDKVVHKASFVEPIVEDEELKKLFKNG